VPRQFATEPQAEKYSAHYVAEKRRSGFAPFLRRGSVPGSASPAAAPTFGSFAEDWTTGKLHRAHPDHVREKRTKGDDVERLALLVPLIGRIPLARFTLDDAERAMAGLRARGRSARGSPPSSRGATRGSSPRSRRPHADSTHS
jgi:hypothetical protein